MAKERTRALRRHHNTRLKNVRKHYWNNWLWREDVEGADRLLGMVTQTPALCSCLTCGNPRKWWKQKSIDQISFEEFASKCDD
jgi:hypothetical protein